MILSYSHLIMCASGHSLLALLFSSHSSSLSAIVACFGFFFFFEGRWSPIDMSSNRPTARFIDKDNLDPNINIGIGDTDSFDVLAAIDGEDILVGDAAAEQYYCRVEY